MGVGADEEEASETKALGNRQSVARDHKKAPCYIGRICLAKIYVGGFQANREDVYKE